MKVATVKTIKRHSRVLFASLRGRPDVFNWDQRKGLNKNARRASPFPMPHNEAQRSPSALSSDKGSDAVQPRAERVDVG
eukprot:6332808-Pyramimonas_sp.AAC.1